MSLVGIAYIVSNLIVISLASIGWISWWLLVAPTGSLLLTAWVFREKRR